MTITYSPNPVTIVAGESAEIEVNVSVQSNCQDYASKYEISDDPNMFPVLCSSDNMSNNMGSCSFIVGISADKPPGTYYYMYYSRVSSDAISSIIIEDSKELEINVVSGTTSDFEISVSPTDLSIQQGESGTVDIGINWTMGTGDIQLDATGGVIGQGDAFVEVDFNPNPVSGNNSVLTLNVGSNAAIGEWPIKIIGTSGSIAKEIDLYLEITSSNINWSTLNFGQSHFLTAVHAVDEYNVMVISEPDKVLITTNGGASIDDWVTKPTGFGNTLYDLFFTTPEIGIVVGKFGAIRRTVDGGDTWWVIPSPTGEHLYGIDFIDDQRGWICGGAGIILYTENAGLTWTDRTASGCAYSLYDICFVNDTVGTAVGWGGMVWKTEDAGLNWVRQINGVLNVNLVSLDFADIHTGSTVGDNLGGEAVVLNTGNGGTLWVQNYTGSSNEFYAIYFVNKDYRYVVGDNGAIYFTLNGGDIWEVDDSGTTQRLRDITQMGNGKLIIVGEGGTVLLKDP